MNASSPCAIVIQKCNNKYLWELGMIQKVSFTRTIISFIQYSVNRNSEKCTRSEKDCEYAQIKNV